MLQKMLIVWLLFKMSHVLKIVFWILLLVLLVSIAPFLPLLAIHENRKKREEDYVVKFLSDWNIILFI